MALAGIRNSHAKLFARRSMSSRELLALSGLVYPVPWFTTYRSGRIDLPAASMGPVGWFYA